MKWEAKFNEAMHKVFNNEIEYSDEKKTQLANDWGRLLREMKENTRGNLCQAYWDVYYKNHTALRPVK